MRHFIEDHNDWLGDLINCPYCTSHWIALGFCIWYKPRVLQSDWMLMDVFVSCLAIIAISSMMAGVVFTAVKATAPD